MKLSSLDLVNINEGESIADSYQRSANIARKLEEYGYERIWVAEHHNMLGIGSAATSLIISHLARETQKIKIGAGGIMLPNHSPLVIAEQFGTLETLYPGRIELGLGRAPGTDALTMRALRRDRTSSESFPSDVRELQAYFAKDAYEGGNYQVRAIPGAGLEIPLWILGSSTFGASLAAEYGLPYAFASHFAPDALFDALDIYRRNFKPSEQLQTPYAMVGVNIILADSVEEAQFLATSQKQVFSNILKGRSMRFPPPVKPEELNLEEHAALFASNMLRYSFLGTTESIRENLRAFISQTQADELMVVTHVFSEEKKIASLRMLAELNEESFL